MTSVSKHINKMKEEYDADVHIRGIQDLIRGLEVCKIVLLLCWCGGRQIACTDWITGLS